MLIKGKEKSLRGQGSFLFTPGLGKVMKKRINSPERLISGDYEGKGHLIHTLDCLICCFWSANTIDVMQGLSGQSSGTLVTL